MQESLPILALLFSLDSKRQNGNQMPFLVLTHPITNQYLPNMFDVDKSKYDR